MKNWKISWIHQPVILEIVELLLWSRALGWVVDIYPLYTLLVGNPWDMGKRLTVLCSVPGGCP